MERPECRHGLTAPLVLDQGSITADPGSCLQAFFASAEAQVQEKASEIDGQQEWQERLLALAGDEFFECSEPKVLQEAVEKEKRIKPGATVQKKTAKARGMIGRAQVMQTYTAPAMTIEAAQEESEATVETTLSDADAIRWSARMRVMPERYAATHQPARVASGPSPTAVAKPTCAAQQVKGAEVSSGLCISCCKRV